MRQVTDRFGTLVNHLLRPTGLMVTRAAPGQAESWRAYVAGPYRSDREVIRLASRAGLSVADYLQKQWGHPGRARRILARLRESGAIPDRLGTVCEIGPGAGGFIQGVFELASPERYEIYEIEARRARWLARMFPVKVRPTPGESLAATPDGTVDLVHAHGVFASLKVITCFAYFSEIARVTVPGGHVCFDIMDDACMGDDDVDRWLESPLRYVNFLSRPLVVRFLEDRGLSLVDDFRLPLLIFGHSTYLVFKKWDA